MMQRPDRNGQTAQANMEVPRIKRLKHRHFTCALWFDTNGKPIGHGFCMWAALDIPFKRRWGRYPRIGNPNGVRTR